jgi:DNA-binding transcriptional MocR family regulator
MELDIEDNEMDRHQDIINMERGWPCAEQLALSMPMLDMVTSDTPLVLEDDYRGYGGTGGILPLRQIFSEILDVPVDQIYLAGTMSTTIMYDIVAKAMFWGLDGQKPWKDQRQVKFICPSPGYEKHFKICKTFGIRMVPVPMKDDGPDMDIVEDIASHDESVKGMWCVPLYSNPTGAIYSEETIRRIACMKAAPDFRVFWDNAYVVHHLTDERISIKNIFDYIKDTENEDRVFEFFSTSKITFPGGGVAGCASSRANIEWITDNSLLQLKTGDKINQYRHALFLKDKEHVLEHMDRHRAIIKPKFDLVDEILSDNFGREGIVRWTNPKGGYFINLEIERGGAEAIYMYCKNNGVRITPAGSTFPYGDDLNDKYLRLAPTYPDMGELEMAIKILCEGIKSKI